MKAGKQVAGWRLGDRLKRSLQRYNRVTQEVVNSHFLRTGDAGDENGH